jgi:hypothetical protein
MKWFRMGQRDLEYAYERFKLDRKIIKPYGDEMEMVSRIQGYEAHFFPWRRWILAAAFSVCMFACTGMIAILFFWIYSSIFTGTFGDVIFILILTVGISSLILAFHLRRKLMIISVDGISLPRVFGENIVIQWPQMTKIDFKASGLGEAITLTVEYNSKKVKTNLGYYTNIYLAGKRKELRLVRVLQAYFRFRVLRKDVEPIRRQIKKDVTKRYGLPEAIGTLTIGLWGLVVRALVFFAGWLIVIPAVIMAIPLGIVGFTIGGLRQGRPWNPKVKEMMVYCSLIITICLIVIILMLLPVFF